MFLVSTRNFPPELGGMQNLMEGLSNALTNHGPVKVFADNHEDAIQYDQNSKFLNKKHLNHPKNILIIIFKHLWTLNFSNQKIDFF